MSIYPTKSYPITTGLSEFDILKASHKFLREDSIPEGGKDNENEAGTSTTGNTQKWEDQLAEKYYESLYREFAVCDLKHYKSGNFALRWRTESEVLSGAGETTCGNTRCKYHFSSPPTNDFGRRKKDKKRKEPQLTTLELPFAYIEHGEPKSALVKVVLCARCMKKLMWKRIKVREEREMRERGVDPATVATTGGVSEDDESEEEQEDEAEKAGRKGKGREREKEKSSSDRTITARRDGDSRRMRSTSALEVEERSGKKYRRDERDSREGEHGKTTRESRSRRRSSRSRSPGRRHF